MNYWKALISSYRRRGGQGFGVTHSVTYCSSRKASTLNLKHSRLISFKVEVIECIFLLQNKIMGYFLVEFLIKYRPFVEFDLREHFLLDIPIKVIAIHP
jgi:hypothetical protein